MSVEYVSYNTPKTSSTRLGVWRSVDNGATFTQNAAMVSELVWHMQCDPNNDAFIVAVGSTGVWVSTDSGATFTKRTAGLTYLTTAPYTPAASQVINGAVSISSPPGQTQTLYVGVASADGGSYIFYWSVDAGASWTTLPLALLNECGTGQTFSLGSQGSSNFALVCPVGIGSSCSGVV